jgi:hypothetical protein
MGPPQEKEKKERKGKGKIKGVGEGRDLANVNAKEKLGASVHLKGGRHWMEAKSTSVVGGFISIELKIRKWAGAGENSTNNSGNPYGGGE